jgi:hypothetical protein
VLVGDRYDPLDADKSLQRRLNSRTREQRSIQRALVHHVTSIGITLSSFAHVCFFHDRDGIMETFISDLSLLPFLLRFRALRIFRAKSRRIVIGFARTGKFISHLRKNQSCANLEMSSRVLLAVKCFKMYRFGRAARKATEGETRAFLS